MSKPGQAAAPNARTVTIDGPVASGKTSVSRDLARALGWSWVSTGAFYRGLAYVAQQENIDLTSEEALADLALSQVWQVEMTADDTLVRYRNQDVSVEIKKEKVGSVASQISQFPRVRASLLAAQRNCANGVTGLVAEGRDCGSVVFPHAGHKFYLTARSESRAERRAKEHGDDVETVVEQQSQRDALDRQRQVAPLQIPEGAAVIDTTQLRLDQVVATILSQIRKNSP